MINCFSRKKKSGEYRKPKASEIPTSTDGNLIAFELSQLKAATDNFSRSLKIGEGGFGSVYKGTLKNISIDGKKERKLTVAIKMLNHNSKQGHKQWLAEVQFLTTARHTNLVKLIGYCAADVERLLVYEYMPSNSLEDHLFSGKCPPLPWNSRLEIALGAAQGLNHLHQGLETQVIFRDFKASNVLLDKEMKAKLSDFGFAREGPSGDRTHVSTDVVGTHGYAAPEYIETGHLTAKSDVWSFGVVLFEIITGRKSFELARPVGEQKLIEWVKQFPAETNRFHMIMDPGLRGQYSPEAARMVPKLADQSLQKNPKKRPEMHEVINSLKNAIQVTNTGRISLESRSNIKFKKR